jgi:hypothetical protein
MKRKKYLIALTVSILGLAVFAQELRHEVSVVNIEVPVRVFRGEVFVDNLTINDFEVLENGKPQTIEAVYLIKKTDIRREEGKTGRPPQVARQFVLFFEMSDYLAEIDKVIDYFFREVILPGDSLIVITPMNQYHLRSEAFAGKSKEKIADELRGKLRKDILIGSSEYRNTIEEMYRNLAADSQSLAPTALDEKLQLYSRYLSRLESLRKVDEKGLLRFADFLKTTAGPKYVYLFYQKEVIPQYDPKALLQTMLENQSDAGLTFKLMELFQFFTRDVGFDVAAVKKAYADSSIALHFLFVTKTPAVNYPVSVGQGNGSEAMGKLTMTERSEDIFSAFDEIAQATGGITESSADAAAAFHRAADASENYYLVYYKPADFKADGQFHEITVKVKTGSYRVLHRAGYIAK